MKTIKSIERICLPESTFPDQYGVSGNVSLDDIATLFKIKKEIEDVFMTTDFTAFDGVIGVVNYATMDITVI